MPVRKVRLKDGTVGYQWGTTGKIYKKREDAEKQGLAILLSQRKKMKKTTYNELKERLEELEKLVNGGKGSGNFGHSGRPGRIGGSAPEGSGGSPKSEDSSRTKRNKENIEKAREYASEASRESVGLADREAAESLGADLSDSGIEKGDRKDFWDSVVAQLETKQESESREYKEGDVYEKDGERMTVKEGKHGLEGISDDGRVVSEVPSRKAIERDKKLIAQLEKKIEDNIRKAFLATAAEEPAEHFTTERQELRERLARIKARVEGYERALTRKANVEKIDKIIGTEKIKQTDDKKNDDANYKKLQSDISKIKKILSTEKSRENFGQEEVRKLKDKYADYMSGNWNVVERFRRAVDAFDDWASNYENSFIPRPEELDKTVNGGKGSGNFGHAGRPGEIGGSSPKGYGASKAERRVSRMGEKSSKSSDSDSGISFEGGSPESVLTIDTDSFYAMEEYTGAGSRYNNGTINLAYNNRVNAPFTIDGTSNDELQQCWDEEDKLREQEKEVAKEQNALKAADEYTYEKRYPWSDKASIFTVESYTSADDVMKSTMPQADKEKYAKLEEKKKALSSERAGLRDKEIGIRKNAKYYPSETGAKGSILIAGLAKGISNYMGQRSDGAGEGAFNENIQRSLNNQSKIHADFIQAMRYPKVYSDTEFNSLRDASAKLATSQGAYLKRIEKDVGKPFMQASEMSNVAKTIKKLTRNQVIADNATSGNEYVSFITGSPVIKKKQIYNKMDKGENMSKNIYKELITKIDNLAEAIVKNGGEGSGNFGHAGRPGEVGGSGDGQGKKLDEKKLDEKKAELNEELKMDGRLSSDDRKALVGEGEKGYFKIAKKIYEYEFDHNRQRGVGYEKPANRGDRIIAKKLGFDTSRFSDSDMMSLSSEEFWKAVVKDLADK